MDFDEYEYLENMVENPVEAKEKVNGDGEAYSTDEKERKRSSKHKSIDDRDDTRGSKRSKPEDESRDHDKERGSRRHSSSRDKERSERDGHRSSREHRDRDKDREDRSRKEKDGDRDKDKNRERDRDTDRKERNPELDRDKDREKDRDRSRRSKSLSERHRDEPVRERNGDGERSRERDLKERERDREREREREFREREHESRRHKDKKEEKVEPQADPERDQRTVFAYQISLKADERQVYDFFSRVGKVRDVRLIMDRISKRSKGFGYVEFYDSMSVPMAIALSGQPLLGQPVMVKPSEAEKNLIQPTPNVPAGAGGLNAGGARKLYVGNLHLSIREDQLRQVFESFGTVELVQLPTDPQTGQCKGFGFVQFARLEDAKAAQNLNGQLEIAGRVIKVSAVTDQTGVQDPGVHAGDIDDDESGGLSLNASSRALLMQKLDRSGTAPSYPGSMGNQVTGGPGLSLAGQVHDSNPAVTSLGAPFGQVAVAGFPSTGLSVPAIDMIGVPSECLLLKNMFDPKSETEPDFDLDIKDDVGEECSKFGTLKHIYVDKFSEGFVYLKFENTQSAMAAQHALHGRWFAGKMITAAYMVPQDYEVKFPDSV